MHNGELIFPCRPVSDIQTRLEEQMMLSESKSSLKHCPACAVKALAQMYWGSGNLSAAGVPRALPLNNPELVRVHNVDIMLRRFTPGAAVGATDAQEDPEEMQTRLLTACLESVDYDLDANSDWETRYDALFILQLECTWRCDTCATRVGTLPPFTNVDGIGFNNISILPDGTDDSVEAAIRRHFTPVALGRRTCATCPSLQPRTESIRIQASPEYLRIKLSTVNSDGTKNYNPLALPEVLDLSEYQAVGENPPLLKYRLNSVISHGGDHTGGHWVASVRGPQHVFYINDSAVNQRPLSQLKANPQVHGGGQMQAVVLMYRRFEKKLGI